MTTKANDDKLWSMPVAVAQIPDGGLHLDIAANEAQRTAMAEAAKVRTLAQVSASFDVRPAADDSFHVTGTVRALVGQDCVVTLEPIETVVEEAIETSFAPQAVARAAEARPMPHKPADDEDGEAPDPPEPIVNGHIDLGRLAQEFLFLGIDPYPRKEGIVFHGPQAAADPDEHPFAALKALKTGRESPPSGKPRRR